MQNLTPILYICNDLHVHSETDRDSFCLTCGAPIKRYASEPPRNQAHLATDVARTAETKYVPKLLALLDRKQSDYGPSNIARHGQLGVVVRLDDKIARLSNLLANKTVPKFESIEDTWHDIANYGIIGSMVCRGDWPKA